MIVVFVGPTLPVDACRQVLDARYLPPVSQGDVHRVTCEGAVAIGIIDGYFERVPAVWHKEILWALSRGVRVFGGASMGALRAVELEAFGMTGVGAIFEAFRDGLLEDDDEVTLVHAEADAGWAAGSVAMVDIRATLVAAEEAGVIGADTAQAILEIGKALFYPDRQYPTILARARTKGVDAGELDCLRGWLPQARVSQKRDDALAMLKVMDEWRHSAREPVVPPFHFEHTDAWEQVVSRGQLPESLTVDDAVPPEWLAEELRLHRDDYERAVEGALARVLALGEAERQLVDLPPTAVDEAVTGLRRRHALVEPDALAQWMAAQGLDLDTLGVLVEQEASVGWVRATYAQQVMRGIPGWLRASGRYGALAARALAKRRVLTAKGLEQPTLADAPVDEASLLRWFFEEHRGEPVPDRLDLHANAVGCAGRAAFVQAVLREYYYLTLRDADASR